MRESGRLLRGLFSSAGEASSAYTYKPMLIEPVLVQNRHVRYPE